MAISASLIRGLALVGTSLAISTASIVFIVRTKMISNHLAECRALLQSVPSPNGEWVVERHLCRSGNAEDNEELSLRTRSETAGESRYPFLRTGSDYRHGLKWLDEKHLLVAGNPSYATRITPYRGIDILYEKFPHNPDVLRNPSTASIHRLPSTFSSSFTSSSSSNPPYDYCTLKLDTSAGVNSDSIQIEFSAVRYFDNQHNQSVPTLKSKRIRSSIAFYYRTDYEVPPPFVTAVALNGDFSPAIPYPRYDRLFDPALEPTYDHYAAWRTEWNLKDFQFSNFLKIFHAENFQISLGFWLDNTEKIYTRNNVVNKNAIDEFDRCLEDNGIHTDDR